MDQQIEDAVAKILEKAMNGIDSAGEFIAGEMPDVVSQLLVWHAIESGLWFLFWASAAAVTARLSYGNHNRLREYLSGGGEPLLLFTHGSPVLFIAIAFMCNTWLKIIVAPKLYLLEYAARIIN